MSRLFLGVCLLLLASGCARPSAPDNTFRFEGALPKDFGLRAQARYALPEGCEARYWDLIQEFEVPLEQGAPAYRFDIPVHYPVGGCQARLVRVGLRIDGRYGPLKWQEISALGNLQVVEQLPTNAPDFDAAGVLHKQAHCGWWFQMSSASSRRGEISKLLNCPGAGAHLPASGLVGKTVRLDFALDREEEPYREPYWHRVPNGWKPCTGRWGTPREELCLKPPQFMPFKMNGRTCTVYPSCTE